jgi:uncharacterized protein involved in exopolysaccharide biosynthesis
MSNTNYEEIAVKEVVIKTNELFSFLRIKWKPIFIISLISGIIGILYATFQKPVYTAEITFAPENDRSGSAGMYAGLAAQFGIDLGQGGGGVFEGENLIEFLKSKMLIEKALLSPVNKNPPKNLLIDYYIKVNKLNKKWAKDTGLRKISFSENEKTPSRERDSIILNIIKDVSENLQIKKTDKQTSIIAATMKDNDELFAKMFIEKLVSNGIQYYVDYRSKKTRENLQILQRQTDSVRNSLTGNIIDVAQSNDLNVNPLRQIVRTNVQRKQVDMQANVQLYGELLKQLELTKITLRKETPLIQIIDTPTLPLEKKKLGRLKGAIIFGFAGFVLILIFFAFRAFALQKPVSSAWQHI